VGRYLKTDGLDDSRDFLYSAGFDRTVRKWDGFTGGLLLTFKVAVVVAVVVVVVVAGSSPSR
jgi:hypothetical protein